MQASVSVEYLGVVHIPQEGISLGVQDEVSPLEPTTVLLLLYVQEAAHTVQPVHVWHAYAITYHLETEGVRQTLQSDGQQGKSRDRVVAETDMEENPSFVYWLNTHKHASTQTEEERDQLTLSSFTCDVIEAEQQTLKPEAELRSSTAARNYRLHSRSARTHISTGQRVETMEDDTMHVND